MRHRRTRQDWHPEDVKAALRKRGLTLKGLALANEYSESMVRQVIGPGRSARAQAIIAACLDLPPQRIWPSRYHADGSPRRPGQYQRGRAAAQRQKREAA